LARGKPIEYEFLKREYVEKLRSAKTIAAELGVTDAHVRREIKRHGLQYRNAVTATRLSNSGMNSARWRGGRRAACLMKRTQEWQQFSAYIKARDNGICQLCGRIPPIFAKRSQVLEAHHITPDLDRIFDPLNVISLCHHCHWSVVTPDEERYVVPLALLAAQNELRRVTELAA
jgi:5-methylcytosine-specific restriction endonuclease McrA